eukprot:7453177-Pyramimonas_sp.AAC.1
MPFICWGIMPPLMLICGERAPFIGSMPPPFMPLFICRKEESNKTKVSREVSRKVGGCSRMSALPVPFESG